MSSPLLLLSTLRDVAMPFKLAATAALLLVLMLTGTAAAAAPPPDFRPFAPDSVWNQTLRGDVPLEPRSAHLWAG